MTTWWLSKTDAFDQTSFLLIELIFSGRKKPAKKLVVWTLYMEKTFASATEFSEGRREI